MSQIDDQINSLSPDELDTLNSDPQMLAQFKAKYAPPPENYAVRTAKNILPDLGQNIAGMMGQVKNVAVDMPLGFNQSIAQKVGDAVTGQNSGPTPYEQATQQFGENLPQTEKALMAPAAHPIDYTEKHPVSMAMNIAALAGLFPEVGADAGIESGVNSFADDLASTSNDRLASINKKLANIPENATKMQGYKQPIPAQADIDTATQNVINAYQQVAKEHGDLLNEAKSNAGLPASKDEIDKSLLRYGNEFGLDLNKPLNLPKEATQNAPETETVPIRPLQPGDKLTLKSSNPDMPDLDVVHKGPVMEPPTPELAKEIGYTQEQLDRISQPTFDLKTDMPANGGDVAHPANSTISRDTFLSHGYTVPEGVPLMKAEPSMRMPYQVGDVETGDNDIRRLALNKEINRFTSNLYNIAKPDQIKAASYFQKQIQDLGVFNKEQVKGAVNGRLKGQYGNLSDVIKNTSPELQQAKSDFTDFKNSLDLVDNKIDPDRPGQTQANLKRMFLSTSPASQDILKQLAYFEQMTGKPVITNLFQKFAGQAFQPLVSRPGREIMEAAGGLGATVMGHPSGAVAAGGLLAAQSPRVLGALEANAPNVLKNVGAASALQAARAGTYSNQPFNTPEMQSMRDKLRNQNVSQ